MQCTHYDIEGLVSSGKVSLNGKCVCYVVSEFMYFIYELFILCGF